MATAYGSITVSKLTDIEDIYFEYSLAVNDANVTNNYPFSQVGELGWTINGESRKTPPAWQNGYKIWVREVKIKTDIATKIYGNPYPDTAINQTSTDLIALQSKIKKIWSNSTGSYMASGIGNNEIDTEVVSTYGFNSKTTTGGISFNYNAIPLTEFGVNGLKLYIPTIANNIVTNSNLGVELTTSALKFYDPTYHKAVMILTGSDLTFNKPNTTTAAAVLNNSGLILSSGGIEAGSKNTTDYIYLYSNDDATNHTLTINGHEASDWRIVAGNKFGVNKAGNLYASNVDISGKITSTEGKIGPWFINNNSISRNANGNAAGSYNTASNIYFGTSGLSLGTAFRVDSSGNLTATGATLTTATIGDGTNKITIGKSSNNSNYSALYSNSHSSLASTVNGFYLGTDGLSIGSNFTVTNTGDITAANVDISGVIKATSGYIGSNATNKITIGNNSTNASIYSGSHSSLDSTNSGFYIGTDGLSIGSKFKYVGGTTETLVVDNITATNLTINSGSIGSNITIGGKAQSDYLNSNIEVGGRNLHKDSANFGSSWYKENATVSGGIGTISLAGSGNHRIYQMPADGYWEIWKANTTYTVSVDAKTDTNGLKLSLEPYAGGVTSKAYSLTTEWKRYSYTFTSNSTTSTASCSYVAINGTSGNVFIKNPKLEYGNKATDWTPAPEDVDASIDGIEVGGRNLVAGTASMTSGNGDFATKTFRASGGTVSNATTTGLPEPMATGAVRVTRTESSTGNIGIAQDGRKGLIVGTQYTESAWIRASVACDAYFQPLWSSNGNAGNNNDNPFRVTTSWQKFTFTGTLGGTQQDSYSIGYVYFKNMPTNAWGEVCALKVEVGNKATDWSPAPEDVQLGGVNLLKDSNASTSNATIVGGTVTKTIPKGTTITISIQVDADNVVWDSTSTYHRVGCETSLAKDDGGTQYIGAWAGNAINEGANIVKAFTGTFHGRVSKTFTLFGDMSINAGVYLYIQGKSSGTVTVSRPQIEIGSTASEWALSPEDAAKTATNYLYADSSGLRIASANPATQNQRIALSSGEVGFYDSSNNKRMYMTASNVVAGLLSGAHSVFNDAGLYMYDANAKQRAVVNASGLNVYDTDGSTNVASFGATARVGKVESANAGNVYIDNDSVDIRKGSTVLSTFTANGAELGKNSDTATISLAGNSGEITGYKWSNTATNDSYNLIIRNNKTVASTGYKALVLDCSHTNHNDTGIRMSVGEYQGDPTDTIYLFADNEMVQVMNGGVFVSSIASSPLNRIGLSSLGQASLELKIADDGDAHGIWTGQRDRWLIGAVNDGYVFSPGVQANTTSGGANVRVQDNIGYLKRYASSSRRYKEDIDDISDESLDPNRLYDLRVAQFRYKEDYLDYDDQRYGKLVNGFIAEEVEEVYPIAVQYENEMVEDWEPKFIIPPMLKLIQDQKKKIDELEQRLEMLERR